MVYKRRKINPVNLPISSLKIPGTINKSEIRIATGMSRTRDCLGMIRPLLLTKADPPMTKEIFSIQAPKIFPMDISD